MTDVDDTNLVSATVQITGNYANGQDVLSIATGDLQSGVTASFSASVLNAYGTGVTLNLTERFRRADKDTLLYEFTVEDPVTFTRPFTASVPMRKSDKPVFEYACHEGNYGLMSIMRGARADDATR